MGWLVFWVFSIICVISGVKMSGTEWLQLIGVVTLGTVFFSWLLGQCFLGHENQKIAEKREERVKATANDPVLKKELEKEDRENKLHPVFAKRHRFRYGPVYIDRSWRAKKQRTNAKVGFKREAFEDNIIKQLEAKGQTVERVACNILPHQEAEGIYAGSNLVIKNNNETTVTHCWWLDPKSKKVGVKAVNRLLPERDKFPAGTTFSIISPTTFTQQAKTLAKAYGITLVAQELHKETSDERVEQQPNQSKNSEATGHLQD